MVTVQLICTIVDTTSAWDWGAIANVAVAVGTALLAWVAFRGQRTAHDQVQHTADMAEATARLADATLRIVELQQRGVDISEKQLSMSADPKLEVPQTVPQRDGPAYPKVGGLFIVWVQNLNGTAAAEIERATLDYPRGTGRLGEPDDGPEVPPKERKAIRFDLGEESVRHLREAEKPNFAVVYKAPLTGQRWQVVVPLIRKGTGERYFPGQHKHKEVQ